jgi:hypothetical protein
MGTEHDNIFLTPNDIVTCAFCITETASPPYPVIDPNAPLAIQVALHDAWMINHGYADPYISIDTLLSHTREDGQGGTAVWITLSREPMSEGEDLTLFYAIAWHGESDQEPTVEVFHPGPWIAYLYRLYLRAHPIALRRLAAGEL